MQKNNQVSLLHSNPLQIGNLDLGQVKLKPKRTLLTFFKSNLVQFIIILIAFIAIIVLSFQVNSQLNKLIQMRQNNENRKKANAQLDQSIKDKAIGLIKLKEDKNEKQLSVQNSQYVLLGLTYELETVKGEHSKLLDTITEYELKDPQESLEDIKAENNKLLRELSLLKIAFNGYKNPKLKNRIAELLKHEDIQLLEQWSGKKLLFACFNTNIHPMSGRQFHEQCNMYSETISLIELDDTIIGGYTSQDWGGNQDKYDDKAFIFNLKNKKKFNIRPNQIAICPNEFDMPVFSKDIALTKDVYFVQFPHSYGTYEDKELFGIHSTMINPKLVEVIVVS